MIAKEENINYRNLRKIFIVVFFFEILIFSYFNNISGYADLDWHIESGQKLLSGNWSLKNIFYSPIFSIVTNFFHINNNIFINTASELLKVIFIFLLSSSFSILIDFKKLSNFKKIKIKDLLPIFFLTLNPYIIKYSSPPYSDTYALLAGLMFSLRYSFSYLNLSLKNQSIFFYKYFACKYYYILLIFLSLIRYPIVIIFFVSIIFDLYQYVLRKYDKNLKFLLEIIFIIGTTILVFNLANNHIEKLNINTNSLLLIITFIISTIGFREFFTYDLSSPLNLINVDMISESLVSRNIFISPLELYFSIFIGIFLFVISVISILMLFYYNNILSKAFLIGFIGLISAELFVGYAHYRYFLLLLPTVIVGFSLKKTLKKIN